MQQDQLSPDRTIDSAERKLTEYFASYCLKRDMVLYARSGERAFVWRSFRTYRELGLPTPEAISSIFDQWAAESPSGQSALAMHRVERNLDVVHQLHILEHDLGQRPDDAARTTANDFSLTFGNVKTIKSRWRAHRQPASQPGASSESLRLEDALHSGSVTSDDRLT